MNVLLRTITSIALLTGPVVVGPTASVAQMSKPGETQKVAAAKMLSVADAHQKAQAGEVVLVDIRTPDEWRETGVPATAHAITMHQDPRTFVKVLTEAMGGDRTRPVALICRTGNRSSNLQAELRSIGFTNVIDVAEGLAGSRHGKGWLKAGLPTRTGAAVAAVPRLPARSEAK